MAPMCRRSGSHCGRCRGRRRASSGPRSGGLWCSPSGPDPTTRRARATKQDRCRRCRRVDLASDVRLPPPKSSCQDYDLFRLEAPGSSPGLFRICEVAPATASGGWGLRAAGAFLSAGSQPRETKRPRSSRATPRRPRGGSAFSCRCASRAGRGPRGGACNRSSAGSDCGRRIRRPYSNRLRRAAARGGGCDS